MARPRLLLVAEFTELQWAIKPLLEEWAEVISYDLPGVGAEPLPAGIGNLGELTREIGARHALDKLEQADWSRYVLVADGWGVANAVGIAALRPHAVAGMALGHAALSYARDGERAPINADVYDAFTQLVNQDAPAFVRYGIAQLTKGGVDADLAERIIERVPSEFMVAGWSALTADQPFEDKLLALDCPLLLAKHEGCLMNTDEGFDDAVSALPRAEVVAFEEPPAASPAFADTLRHFCQRCWSRPPDG
jgi:pimeloyl-ACP methyl ester carboxylesterase